MKVSFTKHCATGLATLLLMACKAEVKPDVGVGGGQPVQTFDNLVQGPNLSGEWQSPCVEDSWSDEYITYNLVFNGQTIQKTETKFSDAQCSTQTKSVVRTGVFRYKEQHVGDIFELEYRFDMPNGYYESGDNIIRSGQRLWISDRRIGSGSMPDIPLFLESEIVAE